MDGSIRDAVSEDSQALGRLFDAYREFYGRASDLPASRAFVASRIADGATRFFIASWAGDISGFVHLVPAFDTLAMRRSWILEDLFVAQGARRSGIGSALLRHAESFARSGDAARLSLTTAHTNLTAQRLYAAHGYALDEVFRAYTLTL